MNLVWLALACAHTPEAPVVDLTTPPTVAAAADFEPPTPAEFVLSNGLRVWVVERPGLPLVSLRLVIPGGSARDAAGQHGAANLADDALKHGAGDRDATAFAAEVERLALSLGVYTGGTASTVSLDAHVDRLDAGLGLMADMILRPRFDDDDVERLKSLQIGSLTEYADDPRMLAAWALDAQYYGDGHPLAHPTEGTIASVKGLKASDLRASYASRFVPDHAVLVVAGAVNGSKLTDQLEQHLGTWAATGSTLQETPPPPAHSGSGRHFFVHKPGTSQTALRIIMPAPTSEDAASAPAELGSIVLGGTFTSRLNRLLREEKGYTYGARASYDGKRNYGYLLARTNVQRDVSAPALVDLLGELEAYTDGIDEVELGKALGSWQTNVVEAMGSRSAIASAYAGYAAQGMPRTSLGDGLDKAQAATVADVNAAVKASRVAEAVIVVVGDLDEIREPIEAAVEGEWTVLD